MSEARQLKTRDDEREKKGERERDDDDRHDCVNNDGGVGDGRQPKPDVRSGREGIHWRVEQVRVGVVDDEVIEHDVL